MKNLILTSALLMTSPATAGVSWVQTPFWQTAFPGEYKTTLETTSTAIGNECRNFENLVFADGDVAAGDLQTDRATFKVLNELPIAGEMTNAFRFEMKLGIPRTMELADLSNSEIRTLLDQKAQADSVPEFTQKPSQVLLQPESLQNRIAVEKQPMSLLSAADRLMVSQGKMEFIRRGNDILLVVTSKAAACDILAHRASLKLNVKVSVRIPLENQVKLQTFYGDVEKIAMAAINKGKSATKRAAIFGYRVSEFIGQKVPNGVVESTILGLQDHLFDVDTMTPNERWTNAFGSKILNVTGTASDQNAVLLISGPR